MPPTGITLGGNKPRNTLRQKGQNRPRPLAIRRFLVQSSLAAGKPTQLCICITKGVISDKLALALAHRVAPQLFLPFLLLHSAATLRIQVMYYKWAKLLIVSSKIVHLVSFIMVLAWMLVFYEKYMEISRG